MIDDLGDEAALVAVSIDDGADPHERFRAVLALARMGNSAGYCGVAAVAAMDADPAWFPQLAQAVTSRSVAVRQGTEQRRIDAVRALVRRCDEVFFDGHLARVLDEHTLPHVADDLEAAITRGVARLDEPRPFDLGEQLADLVAVLGRVDIRSAVLLEKYFKD